MCVYECICVSVLCVYVYAYECICVYLCVSVLCVWVCVSVCTCVCMCVYMGRGKADDLQIPLPPSYF